MLQAFTFYANDYLDKVSQIKVFSYFEFYTQFTDVVVVVLRLTPEAEMK